jgi:hypothetical protein
MLAAQSCCDAQVCAILAAFIAHVYGVVLLKLCMSYLAGRVPKRFSIQREENPKLRMEDMERNTKRWEGDAHTIMCAHYWTPLAEAIGETIAEFDAGFGRNPEAEAMCAHPKLRAGDVCGSACNQRIITLLLLLL